MKKQKENILIPAVVFLIIFLDQLVKYIVSKNMSLNESIPIIKNILHLTYIHNTGASFGILKGQQVFLIIISIIVILLILYYFYKTKDNLKIKISAALILAGAIGNLIDRIRLNYVTDFIDFRIWPAFNVADSCITIGAILIIVFYFLLPAKYSR